MASLAQIQTMTPTGALAADTASGSAASARIAELDGLRGLAALLVVVAHYFGEVPGGFRALTAGWLGVSLFFVLSGFLIGSMILENGRAPNFYPVFYLRRACRILPVYLLTVLTVFGLVGALGPDRAWIDPSLPLTAYLTFTQNIVIALSGELGNAWLLPLWTLAVEEQFYLLAPLLLVLVPSRHLVPVIVTAMAAAVVFRAAMVHASGPDALGALILLPGRWDLLLAGVLAAHLARGRLPDGQRVGMTLRLVPLLCAAALLPLLLLDPQREGGWFAIVSPLVIGIGGASFILAVLRGAPEGIRLRSVTLRWFGTISYGLYLFHQPVAGLLHGLILDARPDIATPPQLAVTMLAAAISIGLAWVSWLALERPVLRFGRRWRYAPYQRIGKSLAA